MLYLKNNYHTRVLQLKYFYLYFNKIEKSSNSFLKKFKTIEHFTNMIFRTNYGGKTFQ